jgi:1-acyl-sn-glycerol-3-phosphate acyltransferase
MALLDVAQAVVSREVDLRVEELELPWNRHGIDRFGISKPHLKLFFTLLEPLYRTYFSVANVGLAHVPKRGRAMLVGNHSGGIAIDGVLVIASMFFDLAPPRLAQGMTEKFLNRLPYASLWSNRVGQFTGLPEHAARLLHDDRLLMVFPEGARGTAKLFHERHSLVRFGSGFMRLALATKTPIVPLACLGGGEAMPTIANAKALGKLLGVPYVPITAYGLPIPLPAHFDIVYGAPMEFDGNGDEEDRVIERYVDDVKSRIATMMERARHARERGEVPPPEVTA